MATIDLLKIDPRCRCLLHTRIENVLYTETTKTDESLIHMIKKMDKVFCVPVQ